MKTHGLWIDNPGIWKGWFGHTGQKEKFIPLRFTRQEADTFAKVYREAQPDATVEVRENPPDQLPWNDEAWAKATE